MTLIDHFIVFVFVILYPAYDYFYTAPKFKKNASENEPGIRIREYQTGIAWIWILSIITFINWKYNQRAIEILGLDSSTSWPVLLSIIFVVIGLIYILYIYHSIKNDAKQRSSLHTKVVISEASVYLPRTKEDFIWFILLSISAGICEEILFRGFLIWYINEFSSIVLAVILSSTLFGLAHSYQGLKGVLQSGATGLVLAVIYIYTGSLWIPIALHIFGDTYSGMLGWLAFDETYKLQDNSSKGK